MRSGRAEEEGTELILEQKAEHLDIISKTQEIMVKTLTLRH